MAERGIKMSSFVLLTRHGPPDLMVEIGQPISNDPVMLSGLFKAIVTFTDEVTNAPLQVLQTKGFTVQFKNLDNDYILIVGTNHTVIGLDSVLNQIEGIVNDGFRYGVESQKVEDTIKGVLNEYVEVAAQDKSQWFGEENELTPTLKQALGDIPTSCYEILFFGLLADIQFRFPKTPSLDLNKNLVTAIEFFGSYCCSDLDPKCNLAITFTSKDKEFKVNDKVYSSKDIISKTELLKDLINHVKRREFLELKTKLNTELKTISAMQVVLEKFNKNSEEEKEKMDNLRQVIGPDLEHYTFLRVNRVNPDLIKYLQENTNQVEWMHQW